MLPDPYTPPPSSHPQYEPATPAVWPWFCTYCGLFAFVYFLFFVMGLVFCFIDPALLDSGSSTTTTTSPVEFKIMGGVYAAIGFPLFLVYAIAPFLPKRPWVWIFDIVLIAFTLSSLCCMPFGIPLLIFWLKDETKMFFGKPLPNQNR